MNTPAISPMSAMLPPNPAKPTRAHDAAQQFESLLIAQMLKSAHTSGGGWLGSEDSAGECATDYAEQQFATVIAQNGGLGLADMITRGLDAQR